MKDCGMECYLVFIWNETKLEFVYNLLFCGHCFSQLCPAKAVDVKYPHTIAVKFDEEHRQVTHLTPKFYVLHLFTNIRKGRWTRTQVLPAFNFFNIFPIFLAETSVTMLLSILYVWGTSTSWFQVLREHWALFFIQTTLHCSAEIFCKVTEMRCRGVHQYSNLQEDFCCIFCNSVYSWSLLYTCQQICAYTFILLSSGYCNMYNSSPSFTRHRQI